LSSARLQARGEIAHEPLEVALLHVRPPEAGEGGIAARGHAVEGDGIGLEELGASRGDALLARDLEHRVVDVARVHPLGGARDELRPVARAASDLEHGLAAEEHRHALAQPLELALALRLLVDLLVFGGAPGVVRLEMRCRAAGVGHG
jgi:hypothetical protein